jgi:hypothetical protein
LSRPAPENDVILSEAKDLQSVWKTSGTPQMMIMLVRTLPEASFSEPRILVPAVDSVSR